MLLATALLAFVSPAFAQKSDAQVRAAIEAAEAGRFDAAQYASLSRDPLYGWIEYAALKRDIDTLTSAQAQAFLARYQGQAVAEAFREA